MTAEENILAQITHLLEEGAMPRSACSGSLLKTLQPLLHAGVVVEEHSGAGRRRLGEAVGRTLDLVLHETGLNGGDGAAELIDPVQVFLGGLFDLIGERFNEV